MVFVGAGAGCISAHRGQWSVYQVQSWDRISSLTPGEMYAIPALNIPLITRKHMHFGHFKGHLGIERVNFMMPVDNIQSQGVNI